MGLDMYGYSKAGATAEENEEIANWRKHNRLHGWMEDLWIFKGKPRWNGKEGNNGLSPFNGIELELTQEDLDKLEDAIEKKNLPRTKGFFFGDDSYDWYEGNGKGKDYDLAFVENARKAIHQGFNVFYNCWW